MTIEECLQRRVYGPALTLKAEIFSALGESAIAKATFKEAFAAFEGRDCPDPLKAMSNWELGWYLHACQLSGDKAKAKLAEDEHRRREEVKGAIAITGGELPRVAPVIVKV